MFKSKTHNPVLVTLSPELHEEEIVERRTSSVKGSMFDYRLRPSEEA